MKCRLAQKIKNSGRVLLTFPICPHGGETTKRIKGKPYISQKKTKKCQNQDNQHDKRCESITKRCNLRDLLTHDTSYTTAQRSAGGDAEGYTHRETSVKTTAKACFSQARSHNSSCNTCKRSHKYN